MIVKLTEQDVTRTICDFLAAHGWRMLRMQSAHVQGPTTTFRVGEPGMPDWLALDYERGRILWIEMKSPNDKRKCRCTPTATCTVCRQELWRRDEVARGATVLTVKDIDVFIAWYREWDQHRTGNGNKRLDAEVRG